MRRTRTWVRDEQQFCRSWSVLSLSTYCCAVVMLQVPYSTMRSICLSARDEQQPCRGWSVGRVGLASAASLPCLQQAERKQGRRSWSILFLSTHCCAVVILQAAYSIMRSIHPLARDEQQPMLQVPYSIMRHIHPSAQDEQQPCRGWSVGRAGLASAASLPCLQQAKRKQGRRSWSVFSLPHNDCWLLESIPSLSHTGMMNRIFPHMFYL